MNRQHPAPHGRRLRATLVGTVAVLALVSSTLPAGAVTMVTINNRKYDPNPATVAVGDTVTWRNASNEDHDVRGGPFTSPVLHPGDTFSFTVEHKGTVNYTCDFHPTLKGIMWVV
jgi:plastocyanin